MRNAVGNIFTVASSGVVVCLPRSSQPDAAKSVSLRRERMVKILMRREGAAAKADAKRLFIASGGALDSESLTPPGSC